LLIMGASIEAKWRLRRSGFYPRERGSASVTGDRKDRVSFNGARPENGVNRGAFP
jgi:hypothetical protein